MHLGYRIFNRARRYLFVGMGGIHVLKRGASKTLGACQPSHASHATRPAPVSSFSSHFTAALGRTKELFRKVGRTLIVNEIVAVVGLLAAGLAPVGLYVYLISLQSSGWGSLASTLLLVFVICTHAAVVVVLLPMVEVVLCAHRAVFVCFVQVRFSRGVVLYNLVRVCLVNISLSVWFLYNAVAVPLVVGCLFSSESCAR